MKILEISTLFPRWPGDGRGPIIIQTAQALQAQGAEVMVISLHGPGSKSHEVIDGVKVYRPRYMVPERWEMLQNTGGGLPAAWKSKPLARLLFPTLLLAQTIAVLRYGRKFDVIHAHFTLPAMAAVLSRWFHRRPIVATVRGSDIYQGSQYRIGKVFNKIALGGCSKVQVMSQDLADYAIKMGIAADKFVYLPPPINAEKFFPGEKPREPILLYVGSLIPRKGARFLVEALPAVFARFPDYRLVMIGSGPEEANVKQLAGELGVTDRIRFIPAQSQAEVGDWMRRAKLFIFPSVEEALGMVAVEALASGLPVVGSNVGGIPEAVSPETGVLVPPGDSQALAAAILDLLGDEEKWSRLSQHAPEWVGTRFNSHEKNAALLIELFQSLIHSR